MRYYFTSAERWRALAEVGTLSASDTLTNDTDLPLTDTTRVRISVQMRRDARRFVDVGWERWHEVIDRVDGSIAWERPMAVCGPSRAVVLVDRGAK